MTYPNYQMEEFLLEILEMLKYFQEKRNSHIDLLALAVLLRMTAKCSD